MTDFMNTTFSQMPWAQNTMTSIIVFLFLVLLRTLLVHLIKRKSEILDKDQRRWINRINNTTTVFIFVALVLIWAPQLQTFALSLTAVAVAIVLITKELLMCLTGGFLRASSKPFEVGDWITVDGLSGEVMKISATMTLLEKVETDHGNYDHTGETIQIPNSRFLTANVENLNFIKKYVYHTFVITVQFAELDPDHLKRHLGSLLESATTPLMPEAKSFNKKVERKTAIDFAEIEPLIRLKTSDLGHYRFHVRIFVPTIKATEIEDEITLAFLKYCYDRRAEQEKEKQEKTPLETA